MKTLSSSLKPTNFTCCLLPLAAVTSLSVVACYSSRPLPGSGDESGSAGAAGAGFYVAPPVSDSGAGAGGGAGSGPVTTPDDTEYTAGTCNPFLRQPCPCPSADGTFGIQSCSPDGQKIGCNACTDAKVLSKAPSICCADQLVCVEDPAGPFELCKREDCAVLVAGSLDPETGNSSGTSVESQACIEPIKSVPEQSKSFDIVLRLDRDISRPSFSVRSYICARYMQRWVCSNVCEGGSDCQRENLALGKVEGYQIVEDAAPALLTVIDVIPSSTYELESGWSDIELFVFYDERREQVVANDNAWLRIPKLGSWYSVAFPFADESATISLVASVSETAP